MLRPAVKFGARVPSHIAVPGLADLLFFLPVGVTAQVLHSMLVGGIRVCFT